MRNFKMFSCGSCPSTSSGTALYRGACPGEFSKKTLLVREANVTPSSGPPPCDVYEANSIVSENERITPYEILSVG